MLVDDRTHCVLSDFGQSEMKSEAYWICGMPLQPWQSVLLSGTRTNYLVTADTTASFVEVGSAPLTDVSFTTTFSRSDNGYDDDPSDPSRSTASSRASSSMQDSWSEHVDYPRHAHQMSRRIGYATSGGTACYSSTSSTARVRRSHLISSIPNTNTLSVRH